MGAIELAVGVNAGHAATPGAAACAGTQSALRAARRVTRGVAAFVSLAGIGLLLGGERLMVLGSPQGCEYLRTTGRACVGCGGTRAYGRAVRGELGAAFSLNAIGAASGIAVWLLTLGGLVSLLRGRWQGLMATLIVVGAATPVAVVVGLVRWLYASGVIPPA